MSGEKKLGILASGFGSNMEAIVQACENKELAACVAVVISDKKEAYVLKRAEKHHIPHFFVDFKAFPEKESYEKKILEILQQHGVEYVILAGYMKIVGKVLLEAFPYRILNIHPALLPSFPGLDAIKKSYDYGVKVTGVTVHFVDEGVDTGPILLQEAVPVEEGETLATLEQKIHEVEHRIYKKAISLLISNKVRIHGRKVAVND